MASVDWKKIKTKQEVFAIMRHDCKDTRLKTKTHNNQELNKDLTHTNTGILDNYKTSKQRYETRMSELPAPRKDSVLGLGFSIPFPKELQEQDQEQWVENVYKLMSDNYGENNICCFVVHRDEVHEYINPETKQREVSRPHIQGIIIPEINGRLCAKEVTARKNMININNVINDMTEETFGISWLTGAKSKSKGNVEDMKYKSRKAELEQKLKELEQQVLVREQYIKNITNEFLLKKQQIQQEIETLNNTYDELKSDMEYFLNQGCIDIKSNTAINTYLSNNSMAYNKLVVDAQQYIKNTSNRRYNEILHRNDKYTTYNNKNAYRGNNRQNKGNDGMEY